MEYSAFEEATVPICTFVLQNDRKNKKGKYIRLSDFKGGMEVQRIKTLEAIENPDCGYYYETNQDNFKLIPKSPIAYWLSNQSFINFSNEKLIKVAEGRVGLITGDNNRFLRLWHEVSICDIGFSINNIEESIESQKRWFPYQKGGNFRKWYGNHEYVVDWENDGYRMKYDNYSGNRVKSHNYNGDLSFRRGIT